MSDEINNPSHYMLFPDMEAIDVIRAALTPAEFAGYCKGNALKYRLRAGEKGPAEKCIAKACWYQNKLREVTRDEFGTQHTIDCRTDEQKAADIDDFKAAEQLAAEVKSMARLLRENLVLKASYIAGGLVPGGEASQLEALRRDGSFFDTPIIKNGGPGSQ